MCYSPFYLLFLLGLIVLFLCLINNTPPVGLRGVQRTLSDQENFGFMSFRSIPNGELSVPALSQHERQQQEITQRNILQTIGQL